MADIMSLLDMPHSIGEKVDKMGAMDEKVDEEVDEEVDDEVDEEVDDEWDGSPLSRQMAGPQVTSCLSSFYGELL